VRIKLNRRRLIRDFINLKSPLAQYGLLWRVGGSVQCTAPAESTHHSQISMLKSCAVALRSYKLTIAFYLFIYLFPFLMICSSLSFEWMVTLNNFFNLKV
jgi:hypothetical protein